MIYEPFVLDFDGTYDLPDPENDIFPLVYFIPVEMGVRVKALADLASEMFLKNDQTEDDRCIADIFEYLLEEQGIVYKCIGELKIPFEERAQDYLTDAIQCVVV